LDDHYQAYVNRVVRITLPETYESQLQHIQESPKFKLTGAGGDRQPVPFPGYTIITPTWEDESNNAHFYTNLKDYQHQLLQQLTPGLVVPVPPESFHLTVADLIWDSGYRHAMENPEFEPRLRERIAQIFQQCKSLMVSDHPIRLQLLGIVVMPRAIGVCLAPKEESSYERLSEFRRAIYQDADLVALGIEQQYHFTAHVTLGYFGDVPANLNQEPVPGEASLASRLSQTLTELNHRWLESEPQELYVHRAELRKFEDMTRYFREPDWATIDF